MTTTILLVDDDDRQRKLSRIYLEDAGFAVQTAANANEALQSAKLSRPDLIVSDVMMGEIDGFGLCRRVRRDSKLSSVPVVLVSAHFGGVADLELAHRVGAYTLVTRSPEFRTELAAIHECLENPAFEPVVTDSYEEHLRSNALQLTKLSEQARGAERWAHAVFDNANDVITVLTTDGVVLDANPAWTKLIGLEREAIIGMHIRDFAPPGHADANVDRYLVAMKRSVDSSIAPIQHAITGETLYVDFTTQVIELDGESRVIAIGRDVTATVAASRRLAAAEEMYRSLVERIPDIIWRASSTGEILFITPNVEAMTGYSATQVMTEGSQAWLARIHPEDIARVRSTYAATLANESSQDIEYRFHTHDRRWIWLHSRLEPSRNGGAVTYEGLISDVTSRRVLEHSLAQAQKMEAIGQLSGGIAHDFNNLLAVILANAQFLLDDLREGDPRRDDAKEIETAAERAALLTRQLLAFSRRQMLEPTTVNVGSVVRGLGKMLDRLISEDVEISIVEEPALGAVRADVGQLEQVIVNLVINARDAMPSGGKLTIETSNLELEADQFQGVPAGRYIQLAVSDTGCGMDSETKRRIFEPFFTTKERGRGTGLGLSTCFGIVKQSAGHICVYSELGVGTVFKVLLPCTEASLEQPTASPMATTTRGDETILVIEDEAHVRQAVARILESRGYNVLTAEGGDAALRLANDTSSRIDLIVSDVVLPGASGPEIVRNVQAVLPDARLLLMSGYTDHALLRDGCLEGTVNFLQKPFASEALAKKVREVLDR